MNREEAKELLPIIHAFAEGKKIEYSTNGENWSETETPIWDNYFVYRVKSEHKFDPKTLKPFDRVLGKDEGGKWTCDFYSRIGPVLFICIGACWRYCIPYNDDTKHLLDTTNEAPEYYRYWEE